MVCGLIVSPHFMFAAVVMNEVAWMGSPPKSGETATQAANNEWVELFNDGAPAVDLTGWRLDAADGTPAIPLSGSIPGGGFFLLERTDDETVPGIVADMIYTGALSNSGEALTLKDAAGNAVHAVDASGGWPAGDNGTKDTMQRSGAGWITASPTPRAQNSASATSPPPPPPASTTPVTSAGAGDAGRSPPSSLGTDAGSDAMAIAGAIVLFRGQAFGLDGEPLPSARFLWNFGDGSMKEGKALNHIYYFPGTYRAELAVSSGEFTGSDWRTIIVRSPELSVSEAMPGEDGFVELSNASAEAVDLGGMRLIDQARTVFSIPPGTLIEARSVLVLANRITGLHPSASLALHDASTRLLDSAVFSGALGPGGSFERRGSVFEAVPVSTPGTFSFSVSVAVLAAAPGQSSATLPAPPLAEPEETATPSDAAAVASILPSPAPAALVGPVSARGGRLGGAIPRPRIFLAASIMLGLIAAAALVVLKRRMPGGGIT